MMMTTQKKKDKKEISKKKKTSKTSKTNEPKIKFKVIKEEKIKKSIDKKTKLISSNKKTKKIVKPTKSVKISPPKLNTPSKDIAKKSKKSKVTKVEIVEKTKEKPVFADVPSLDETNTKRRRGRNKKDKIYFSKKTEEAIIEYNSESCMDKRNEIYEERIKYSFEKLVENIFNTFKFTYFDNSPIEIQRETVSHLVSNMHKFQEGKGKAFSYFSIVAKNYLIFHNNNNYKRYNQHVDISETPSETSVCLQTEDEHHREVQNKEFMKLLIDYWEKNITKIFTKNKDLNIAYAVIELFRNCTRIENFNKKTLYLYIRELSNCKTQQITKVINKMKNYQNVISQNYLDDGTI